MIIIFKDNAGTVKMMIFIISACTFAAILFFPVFLWAGNSQGDSEQAYRQTLASSYGDIRIFPHEREEYRMWEDYEEEILFIADYYSHIVDLHILGYSHQGRPMYALEISTDPGKEDGRPEHVHEGLAHAREWNAGEFTMDLAWYLVENYDQDDRITDIVENIRTWIIPAFNPDGFIYSRTVHPTHRTNMREYPDGNFGVDINRNFSYLWGADGSGMSSSGTNMGPWAFSEPENAAYCKFNLQRDVITSISSHNFGAKIYYQDTDVDPEILEMTEVMAALAEWDHDITYVEGGSQYRFLYGVLRQLGVAFEHGRERQPPIEGYPAPALETNLFGIIEANQIKETVDPFPISAEIVDCGFGGSGEFPEKVNGNIALIERYGGYGFLTKASNAEANGAAAVIIFNRDDWYIPNPSLGSGHGVSIPVLNLQGEDGRMIIDALDAGSTVNADILPNYHVQDSYHQYYRRALRAALYAIEMAPVHASVIEGTVQDALSDKPLQAELEKSVELYAPFGGAYEGFYMEHEHRTRIETSGSYRWHTLPSKQPFLDTPPYKITATAPGYYPQSFFLEINGFRELHELNFTLQPVVELQNTFTEQELWPVNSTVPVEFITVDSSGHPQDMENVTVNLFVEDSIAASFNEGPGINDIAKGSTGEYRLDLQTWELELEEGSYKLQIKYTGDEGKQAYETELNLSEQLTISGTWFVEIPGSGEALPEAFAAHTYGPNGETVNPDHVNWSLMEAREGILVDGAGNVTISDSAENGTFTLTAEAGDITGQKTVVVAPQELASPIIGSVEDIASLPAAVTLDELSAVQSTRAGLENAVSMGAIMEQFINIAKLTSAERKIAALQTVGQAQADAALLAEEAISALPATISSKERHQLRLLRNLANNVHLLGASEETITNIEDLREAEEAWSAILAGHISEVEDAINLIPEQLTLQDDAVIIEARARVNELLDLRLGLEESDVDNIHALTAAENKIEELYGETYIRQSLFNLGDPGSDYHNISSFMAFGHDRWWFERTIRGECFLPLGNFTVSYRNLNTTPRWAEWDISDYDYHYVEGYVGASDSYFRTFYDPVTFRIYLDNKIAFEAELECYKYAKFYRLDVSEAEKFKIYWFAESVGRDDYANRISIVEPQFLMPREMLAEDIALAENAIDALPAIVTLADHAAIYEARNLVRNVVDLGAAEKDISNLKLLENAEQALEGFYKQNYMKQSLLDLPVPNPDEYNGWAWFARNRHDRWWTHGRTVRGVDFLPLPSITATWSNIDQDPRWIDYDISARNYTHVKGYVGIVDDGRADFPPTFRIYGDGSLLYEATLDYGEYAEFYLLEIDDVDTLRFFLTADETSDAGWYNRTKIVMPQFLLPITGAMLDAVEDAEKTIAELPVNISLLDKPKVEAARAAVSAAFKLGVEERRIRNLSRLEASERDINDFYHQFYELESLFALGDPGSAHRNMSWFVNFEDYWEVHHDNERSINRQYFAPLQAYASSINVTYPRYVEWDISQRNYSYIEGFLGIADSSTIMAYPLDFTIFGDGEPLLEARLEYGMDAKFYRLNLEGVDKLKIQWAAEKTDGDDGNRPVIVEPQFLHSPKTQDAIDAAEAAISSLPAQITHGDRPDIEAARVWANNALAIGVQESGIKNLTILEDAEDALAKLPFLYGDLNGDGKVGIFDIIIAMQHVLGLNVLSADALMAADVNNDGKIDIDDIILIMQLALGLPG